MARLARRALLSYELGVGTKSQPADQAAYSNPGEPAPDADPDGTALLPLRLADYRISVVLPVYSETQTVAQIADWLRNHLGPHLEEIIIVLSPHSQQRSKDICEQL